MQFANLLRCAVPVAPYLVRYSIQHTDCLLPCGLLNVTSSIRGLTLPLLQCYYAFPCGVRQCSYLLVFSIRCFGCMLFGRQPSYYSPTGSVAILSDNTRNLLDTAFLRTGLAFALRVKSNPGLYSWTIAGASL